jgi:predicted nucleotide-binding protein with TIR-like domain/histidine-specific SAM-dependent methyltransferase
MAQFSIFIASSGEQKTFATDIADALSKLGHRPIRWWTSFPASSYTLEALEAVLRQADAGVFLCVGDDKGVVRSAPVEVPRDNVILELGLFLGVLGRRRCFIVADKGNTLRLPSDLAGITRIGADQDADSIASFVGRGIEESFISEPRPAHDGCINIRADGAVTMRIGGPHPPPEWRQRALYFGTEGAKCWLAYSDDEYNNVQTDRDRVADTEQTMAALAGQTFRTLISLGPGDARRDKDIFERLQASGPVAYVPVDISEGLIHSAARSLASAGAPVPFGLLADFEDGQDFLFENIKALPQPRLFTLLGNTLGNLDIGAERFLRQMATRMRRGDQLLLDVTTTNGPWEFAKSYFESPVRQHFIAQGIARQLGIGTHEVLGRFAQRIDTKRAGSPLAHVEQRIIYDKEKNKIAMTVSAYYFDKFLDWIRHNVALKDAYAHPYSLSGYTMDSQPDSQRFGAGLIRLAKQ